MRVRTLLPISYINIIKKNLTKRGVVVLVLFIDSANNNHINLFKIIGLWDSRNRKMETECYVEKVQPYRKKDYKTIIVIIFTCIKHIYDTHNNYGEYKCSKANYHIIHTLMVAI